MSPHSPLGRSTFEVLYGFPPHHFGLDPADAMAIPELHNWLEERVLMHDFVHQHLTRAQACMKQHADKDHSEQEFVEGDLVFLKL